ncbi:hypothetical protein FB561_6266 [Kribbella amoyensis]|uniref:DUF732 domain-containing protein n=1 Tax=Kribbella amoyensis TaxID=996641 RepID=A0A561B815_9ACTN|nr:hypothetical protein [Kribbella amoyensis]TWD74832.1 hypothetical protein FB561_6266 [Kribbella amoyensis]
MSTMNEMSTKRERRTIYIVIGAALVVLLIIGLITYSAGKSNREAEDKANQLIGALHQAGIQRTPSVEQITGVLGDDGGALCADPSEALSKAILYGMIANGAGGPGARPVIADSRIIKGQLLVIKIYCPDELPKFQQYVDQLEYDDTINE